MNEMNKLNAMNWIYCEKSEAYFVGNAANGAGVFYWDSAIDDGWHCNLVKNGEIIFADLPDAECPADAKAKAEGLILEHDISLGETELAEWCMG